MTRHTCCEFQSLNWSHDTLTSWPALENCHTLRKLGINYISESLQTIRKTTIPYCSLKWNIDVHILHNWYSQQIQNFNKKSSNMQVYINALVLIQSFNTREKNEETKYIFGYFISVFFFTWLNFFFKAFPFILNTFHNIR